jgi:hypothetical protein
MKQITISPSQIVAAYYSHFLITLHEIHQQISYAIEIASLSDLRLSEQLQTYFLKFEYRGP